MTRRLIERVQVSRFLEHVFEACPRHDMLSELVLSEVVVNLTSLFSCSIFFLQFLC